ncbi:MAG: peptide chain release factor N(5)-glutamine methyltransferase [Flavobacteriaceae bacterium]|nr:peptide chain release factor N(5)-glutamine methyltransferase [Flavobacteriaceae bacterium]MDZ4147797.1 peptide chain release factor N(5)-glutamine methyltransferase [Flavobacteriaceae bacterium]
MTLNAFRILFFDTLKSLYELEEIQGFYSLLLNEKLGISRVEAVLQSEKILDASTEIECRDLLKRLENQEPIQYILNRTHFCDLPFLLNANVLIPRPETEELVYWMVSHCEINLQKKLKILDIGTGSGCIAVSLAKLLPKTEVSAMDLSREAIQTARENAALNQVQIDFMEADILKTSTLGDSFDIIVSNPPYVLNAEKSKMRDNVLKFEPHKALFVPDTNPLIFYEKITKLAIHSLRQNGLLFFEINEAYGNEVRDILAENGFIAIELKADLFGKNRMIKGRFS